MMRLCGNSRLGRYRVAAGMSQIKSAALSGVSHSSWCDYENGTRYPSLDKAYRIAEILNATVYDLWPIEEVNK